MGSEDILTGHSIEKRAGDMKDSLTSSFAGIRARVGETAGSLESLIRLMEPYVEYFFSGGKGENSFLGDIVFPAEKNLNTALQAAVVIMNGDEQIHRTIYTSLSRTMLLREYVERIVSLMESMEIYALNTMIMSAKSGLEGAALETISTQMARLSRSGNELSEAFSGKMENLQAALLQFKKQSEQIEAMHESSLTGIHISSSSMFKNLITEFNCLSGEVLGVYGMMKAVFLSIRQVTEKFQYEDLLRQDLEKMLYVSALSSDMNECSAFALAAESDQSSASAFFYKLAHDKLEDISGDVTTLHSEIISAISEVSTVISTFETMLQNTSAKGECRSSSSAALVSLCEKLEQLKGSFSDYIESVLNCKNNLFKNISAIDSEIRDLSVFFDHILDISRKFQNIILMTRIEIARHDDLQNLLGGTLSDVMMIPNDIRSVIEDLLPLYNDISASLVESVQLYKERYTEQKRILDGCVETIKNVSVQIYESKKYHDDFIAESDSCTKKVYTFIASEQVSVSIFSAAADQLADLMRMKPQYPVSSSINDQLLSSLRKVYSSPASSGDYRAMMLLSLASEYSKENKAAGGTIDFF